MRVRSMTEEFDTGTSTGRLMLTLLSGFASHERDVIRERSVAGTFRVAETGVWLGGIVPYGYRKVGERRDARLVISEDPVPGLAMSEAEIMGEVFRMSSVERRSCRVIADWLNQLHVPCAYVRDDRLQLRGKRKQKTSGLWRPGRVRGLLTNKTYMGVHEFGKRASGGRPIVARSVPAIVTEDTWKKAQQNLSAHMLFCKRNAHNQYLLRGLIKCGVCGLTYIGIPANRHNGRGDFYYRCNGVHSRGLFGALGQKCPSKAVRGDHLERLVWADVEGFLRNPGSVLHELQAKLEAGSTDTENLRSRQRQLEALLTGKAAERNRVVGLYRRGGLDDAELDQQLREIGQEEKGLQAQLDELQAKLAGTGAMKENLSSADALLTKLRQRLEGPVSWECKRQLIEVLVGAIRVEPVETCGVVQPKVTIAYRFEKPNELERVVPPAAYLPTPIRIPVKPETVGDHLRIKRLGLKLFQKDVAQRLGVDTTSVHNWEVNAGQPALKYLPAIIEFLGYNPLPPANNLVERLVRGRTSMGLSQKEAASRMGVDPSTLAKWERGEREPAGEFAARVMRFLAKAEDTKREAKKPAAVSLDVPVACRLDTRKVAGR